MRASTGAPASSCCRRCSLTRLLLSSVANVLQGGPHGSHQLSSNLHRLRLSIQAVRAELFPQMLPTRPPRSLGAKHEVGEVAVINPGEAGAGAVLQVIVVYLGLSKPVWVRLQVVLLQGGKAWAQVEASLNRTAKRQQRQPPARLSLHFSTMNSITGITSRGCMYRIGASLQAAALADGVLGGRLAAAGRDLLF